jgi:hypothetical protein
MGSIWMWVGFNLFVLALLALDLGVFHRKAHAISVKEATIWSVVWISLALLFNLSARFPGRCMSRPVAPAPTTPPIASSSRVVAPARSRPARYSRAWPGAQHLARRPLGLGIYE